MTKKEVVIRLAIIEDIPKIMVIVKAAVNYMNSNGNFQWSTDYPTSSIFQSDISKGELWVAILDDEVVGVAAINQDHTPEYDTLVWNNNAPYWGIHRVAISEQFKGNRIAEKLFIKAEEIARQSIDNYLRIDTNLLNKPAQRLFERLGYSYIGQVYFAKTSTPFVCYDKILES